MTPEPACVELARRALAAFDVLREAWTSLGGTAELEDDGYHGYRMRAPVDETDDNQVRPYEQLLDGYRAAAGDWEEVQPYMQPMWFIHLPRRTDAPGWCAGQHGIGWHYSPDVTVWRRKKGGAKLAAGRFHQGERSAVQLAITVKPRDFSPIEAFTIADTLRDLGAFLDDQTRPFPADRIARSGA